MLSVMFLFQVSYTIYNNHLFYRMHLLILLFLTGKYIFVGNIILYFEFLSFLVFHKIVADIRNILAYYNNYRK